ncbi:MAG TPA: hypothetical protein EYP90_01495 [Chromatiaceae bacterium]|nr:hypothetical protein [Chromatiaceae bacterium]
MKVTLEIDDAIARELTHLVALHQAHGAPNPHTSIESLLAYAASALADGSRRPGSWERQLLEMMGLVPDTDEAQR